MIERYLAVAAVALLVFAGGRASRGFTMLRRGRLRTAWMAASAALVVFGIVFTATHVRLDHFDAELSFRGAAHDDLVRVLESPAGAGGAALRAADVPNHKLVPDSRWILDLPDDRVIPRAEPGAPEAAQGRRARRDEPLRDLQARAGATTATRRSIQVPPPGWRRIVTGDFYTAYAQC